ncbi:cysteine synthase A [Clostridiales Family XIII bacterium PM5-7]
MIYHSIIDTIGKTPLLRLHKIEASEETGGAIYGKLEAFNPAGSIKDRAALSMVLDAEKRGVLQPGGTIIEPTSGNTGIGLAAIAASKGYKTIFVLPESMSIERRQLLKAYGAQLVLTDASKGMQGAVEKAEELQKELTGSIIAGQFVNPANAQAHRETTGPEIWDDLDGNVDVFVAGVGTGGTITGAGKFLKEKNPKVKIVAVEPEGSPLLSKGRSGKHNIQGIGANFVPELLDREIIDEVVAVSDEEAYSFSRKLAREEGYLVGISAGAALFAATEIAKRPEYKGKNVVVILPDTGERYLSTELFTE